jgi:hypothetical protein
MTKREGNMRIGINLYPLSLRGGMNRQALNSAQKAGKGGHRLLGWTIG